MARIKMHIPKAKLPFYSPCEIKCRLQNGVSTIWPSEITRCVMFNTFSLGWVEFEEKFSKT